MVDLALRSDDGRMLGVLRDEGRSLEIKRGNRVYCINLIESWRQGRSVVLVRVLDEANSSEAKDSRSGSDIL
jgi:hypothetical protein